MPDMLVKLYDLPLSFDFIAEHAAKGVTIRKPISPEKTTIVEWVRKNWSEGWASEFAASLPGERANSWVATEAGKIIGFACHNSTAPGFFGPTGVLESHRGRGIGKALLMACLMEMKLSGYGYAIIGGAGPTDFYAKACGAVIIPGSIPGIYAGMVEIGKS